MKAPKYIKYEWDTKPTDIDEDGCDGMYIVSIKILWWGWPFLFLHFLKNICRNIGGKLWPESH